MPYKGIQNGSGSLGHGANAHNHSQRPVPRGFPLFKGWVAGGQLNHVHLNVIHSKLF